MIEESKNPKYGTLITPDIKLNRQWFREMVKLIGIYCIYRAPKDDKHWTQYNEIESNYQRPRLVGCIFTDHPTQSTMKKLGWDAELQENAAIIQVDYDLPDIQVGALFIVPSGLDNTKGRLFRVVKLQYSMVYPACIDCMIIPEYEDTFVPETGYDFEYSNHTTVQSEVQGDVFAD